MENISAAIEHIFPLVYEYRMEKAESVPTKQRTSQQNMFLNPAQRKKLKKRRAAAGDDVSDDESVDSEYDDEDSDFSD